MKLQGRTALVTGAGTGIGKAIAVLFAAEGATVVAAEISEERGRSVTAELQADGRQALFVQTDVADEAQVRTAVQTAVDAFGRLDIVANIAGLGANHPSWEKVIRVNVQGVYYGFKYGYEAMLEGGGGAIVSTSTAWAVYDEDDEASLILKEIMQEEPPDWLRPLAGCVHDSVSAYVLSKRMVNHFTRVFAMKGATRNIRANAIAPGFTRTEMARPLWADEASYKKNAAVMPMNRFAEPEEIARAALFLVSDDASFVTGAVLAVDAGFSASQRL